MPNRWQKLWPGWLSFSRILGMLVGLVTLGMMGRRMVSHRQKGAEARHQAEVAKEKAVLAEAGIERAVWESKVIQHSEAAMAHEERIADYEARIKAAKAKVARLRGKRN